MGIAAYTVSREDQDIFEEIQDWMDTVSATREYPATFSIWSQLLLSIVLPKAVQLCVASI